MVNIKKISVILAVLAVLVIAVFVNQRESKKLPSVLISQTVNHPAIDATVRGILDSLAAEGFKEGQNITIRLESAQADPALAAQIASNFMGKNPEVVVGVATMASQAFLKYRPFKKTALVFSTVTDPVGAGLVSDGITGVSNFVPLEPQLTLFKKILPNMTKLGILYNPGEANSVSIVRKLEEICPRFGLTLVKQTVTKTGDAVQNATLLAQKADAVFVSNDNTVLSAIKAVISAAKKQKIPVFVSDTDAVALGALAALGPNQYDIGRQTGSMIAKLLRGKKVSEIAIEYPVKTELFINRQTAKELGIFL
ncbi:MAG: ABC transporter substrate-binding protein [Myxococcaceae bacterium]